MTDTFDLWLNQVCESEGTTRRYLQGVRHFEAWAKEKHELIVKEVPTKWRQAKYSGEAEREKFLDELRDVVSDYFAHLKKSGYTPLYINTCMSIILSFVHYFDIPLKPIRIRRPFVSYHNRDITKEEIRTIIDHSDIRNKAVYLMLYESGMRPSTLVNLKWKHIKTDFLSHRIPMRIDLPSDVLKCRVSARFTFLGVDGYEALQNYLKPRLPLKDDDLAFVREKPAGGKLGETAISQSFNKAVKKLKLTKERGDKPKDVRLYNLRKAFRKFTAAEIDSRYPEYWLGHTSTETHYLSEDVEHHRALYERAYAKLRISEPQPQIMEELKKKDEQIKDLRERLEQWEPIIHDLEALQKSPGKRLEFFVRSWLEGYEKGLTQEQGAIGADLSEHLSKKLAETLAKSLSLELSRRKEHQKDISA